MLIFYEMRVSGGIFRGRKLKVPKGVSIRPTSDIVKEAIFNIIHKDVEERDVLDLFAGSGALGIEALSRGAKSCVFVDNSLISINTIKKNLQKLNLNNKNIEILKIDVFEAITSLQKEEKRFDIIFFDPPYKKGLIGKALILLTNYDICKDNSFIIAEHSCREEVSDRKGIFSLYKKKRYGDTIVSIFKKGRGE